MLKTGIFMQKIGNKWWKQREKRDFEIELIRGDLEDFCQENRTFACGIRRAMSFCPFRAYWVISTVQVELLRIFNPLKGPAQEAQSDWAM